MVTGVTCCPQKGGVSITRQDTGSSPAPARKGFDFSKLSKDFPVEIKLTFNVLWRHQAFSIPVLREALLGWAMDFSVKIIGVLHRGHQYKCKHELEQQRQ